LGNDDAYFDVLYAFVSTVLTVYFLPKLVAKNNQETKTIFDFIKGYYPFLFWELSFILLVFLSLNYFFTGILPVTTLFFWQLVGDVLWPH
jgi:PST family polysaccharide transporter